MADSRDPVTTDMLAEYREAFRRIGRGHDTFDVRVLVWLEIIRLHGDDSAEAEYAERRVDEWPD